MQESKKSKVGCSNSDGKAVCGQVEDGREAHRGSEALPLPLGHYEQVIQGFSGQGECLENRVS